MCGHNRRGRGVPGSRPSSGAMLGATCLVTGSRSGLRPQSLAWPCSLVCSSRDIPGPLWLRKIAGQRSLGLTAAAGSARWPLRIAARLGLSRSGPLALLAARVLACAGPPPLPPLPPAPPLPRSPRFRRAAPSAACAGVRSRFFCGGAGLVGGLLRPLRPAALGRLAVGPPVPPPALPAWLAPLARLRSGPARSAPARRRAPAPGS
mgnify:CR=1 FL=1